MTAKQKFHGRMLAMAGAVIGNTSIENPDLGMLATVNSQVCVYDNVGGAIGWYPIAKAMDTKTYRHIQVVPSLEWTVTHNLGTKEFFAVVTDNNDNSIVTYAGMDFDPVDPLNKFKVTFAEPIAGNMFIVVAESFSTPELNTSKINLGDLVISTAGISWKGNYLDLESFVNVDNSINTLLASNTTLSANVTAMQAALAGEITRAQASETDLGGRITAVNSAITLLRQDMNNGDAARLSVDDYWATKAIYDITASDAGNVAAGQVIFDMPALRKFILPANLAGMRGVADVGPAVATDFYLTVNGVTKFTLSFAAGATAVSAVTGAAVQVNVGDRVRIFAARADTAIKNIAIAIPAMLAQ